MFECGERRTCVGERQNIKLCYVHRVRIGKCVRFIEFELGNVIKYRSKWITVLCFSY